MHGGVLARIGPPTVVFAILVGGWAALVRILGVPPVILPGPGDVLSALVATWPTLLHASAITGATAALGLLAGMTVGFVLACATTASRDVERTVMPYVVALRIAPLSAIGPVFFLVFGPGILARAALVSTLTFFPVTIATHQGLRNVPPAYLDVARAVGAPRWRVFAQVRTPVAARSVLAGVKLAATLAVVGAVVAEFVTLQSGLGYRVFHTAQRLQTPQTFAALVALIALGLGFYGIPAAVERVLVVTYGEHTAP